MIKDRKLSEHFMLSEFLHDGVVNLPNNILLNLTQLAHALEKIRANLGNRPMTITSGYRTWAHHIEIYRRNNVPLSKIPKGSYHLKGLAADFVVEGLTPQQVQAKLDPWWDGGLEFAPTWTHADLGQKRRFKP